jgi:hypothetical protein
MYRKGWSGRRVRAFSRRCGPHRSVQSPQGPPPSPPARRRRRRRDPGAGAAPSRRGRSRRRVEIDQALVHVGLAVTRIQRGRLAEGREGPWSRPSPRATRPRLFQNAAVPLALGSRSMARRKADSARALDEGRALLARDSKNAAAFNSLGLIYYRQEKLPVSPIDPQAAAAATNQRRKRPAELVRSGPGGEGGHDPRWAGLQPRGFAIRRRAAGRICVLCKIRGGTFENHWFSDLIWPGRREKEPRNFARKPPAAAEADTEHLRSPGGGRTSPAWPTRSPPPLTRLRSRGRTSTTSSNSP